MPDGTPAAAGLGAKALALLAFLALEPGPHSRDEVAALLWGEFPDEKAKASLRQALTHLRDAVGDAIRVDRLAVEATGAISCDVSDFTRLAPTTPFEAAKIEIPRFLGSLAIRNSPGFEDWAAAKRVTLVAKYVGLLARCTRDAMARRAWRDAARFGSRWSELEPANSEAVMAVIEAQYLLGDREAARETYAQYSASLSLEGKSGGRQGVTDLMARFDVEKAADARPRATEEWYDRAPSFEGSLVGRTHEWTVLEGAWAVASGGAARIAMIEGEPGTGKTRLAEDFLRLVETRGGIALRGRGYDARAGAQFAAVMEAFRSALDAPGVAGVDPEWLAEMARLLPEVRRRFPHLPDTPASTSGADSWRLFEAAAQVLLAISEESPIAILIDDLQWCDADSCALLHFLVRRLTTARILWCATLTLGELQRDAPAARLSRALRAAPQSRTIALAPMTEAEVLELLADLGRVNTDATVAGFATLVHAATAGNPFYVVELLKTLFARGLITLQAESGVWLIAPSLADEGAQSLTVPTVHDAIAERIECLPDRLRSVLITLSVAGRGCSTDLVSHVHGISRLHAAALGDSLVERHLVVEEAAMYRCAHPIIANVVRTGIGTSRRREVHRAIAYALEALLSKKGSREEAGPGDVARHAEQAGDSAMAYRYALQASDSSAERGAHGEALSWLDLAAASADGAVQSEAVDRRTANLLEQAGWRGERGAPAMPAKAGNGRPELGGMTAG